jgi:hypothetical protein
VLVVAAHPDDEALGCGGTIARHVHDGDTVDVVFLADGVTSRSSDIPSNEALKERRTSALSAGALLGVAATKFGDFPDNSLDTVPLLDLAQFVETHISRTTPDVVYTHHGGDLNVDHRLTHEAVLTACRPQPDSQVRTILTFETPSSTEWRAPGPQNAFIPHWFVDITHTIDKKISALRAYDLEMRDFPHARSIEAVIHLNRWRGASVGYAAAEAFSLVRHLG